jgi:hypothetical protein
LSRTVTGNRTSRAWTFNVTGWLEAGCWTGLAADKQVKPSIEAERQKAVRILMAVKVYTLSLR